MNYELEFADNFYLEISKHKKAGNTILLKKINVLLNEIRQTPFAGTGKPEQLKYLQGVIWSRRIDIKHRLTYELVENHIEVLSCYGHYDDK